MTTKMTKKKSLYAVMASLFAVMVVIALAVISRTEYSENIAETVLGEDDEREIDGHVVTTTNHPPPTTRTARHLFLDNKVRQRYLADPPGFRKHPSYYSESYLRRARDITEAEKKDLTEKWGSWTLIDSKRSLRPGDDFYTKYPNRDVPFADFPPETAWQKDKNHMAQFLDEGIDLTKRAMQAILTEYGKGPANADDPYADFIERSWFFKIDLPDHHSHHQAERKLRKFPISERGGRIPQQSWDGLKRRLLHAVMTEDSFNLVMGGHSSAAGHGNHFKQSYTLQYGKIMEPIFARLGVKGTASNIGMGGLGTMQNSIGAGSIYGHEVDILVWDSGMTEPAVSEQGIFATQGLLGSNRAPFLWYDRDSCLNQLFTETGADIGVYGDGLSILTEAANFEALSVQPWAARYLKCDSEIRGECNNNRYNGTCWIDRPDFSWEGIELENYKPEKAQKAGPGGRAKWHPGNRVHQMQGRVLSFVVLQALLEALTDWKQADNYQLADEAWHVTEHYKNIHDKVAASSTTDAWCQAKGIPLTICRNRVSARSELTPRARPWETSIRSIIKSSRSNLTTMPNAYDPPDVYNPILEPPPGEIDVLAIVENGVDFAPNLARIRDSNEKMTFQETDKGGITNPEIVPGKGWGCEGASGHINCDGMYDSHCNRGRDHDCLLYGHNDYRGSLSFDSLSGWMVFNIPKIEHGFIMLSIYDWFSDIKSTAGWCSENDEEDCTSRNLRERTAATTEEHMGTLVYSLKQESRQLKAKPIDYCPNFKFEYAINGHVTSLDLDTWKSLRKQVQRVVTLWVIKDDPSFTGENVEFAIRMTGCGEPKRRKAFGLTHIYWA